MTTALTGELTVSELLEHHGVKGMHWGVRKDQYSRSTETAALRKQSKNAYENYVWENTKDEPLFALPISSEEYKRLSTKGRAISEGTSLHRITKDPNAEINGALYVSKLRRDANFYRAAIPAANTGEKKAPGAGSKVYRNTSHELDLKTVAKLSLPSEKERVDAFIDILGMHSIHVPGESPITGSQYLERNGYSKIFNRKLSDQDLGLKAYNDFVRKQGEQDLPINSAYFDRLREKGYNALVDENDMGKYTKLPLILLDPSTTTKVVTIRRLSADEINKAQRDLAKAKE